MNNTAEKTVGFGETPEILRQKEQNMSLSFQTNVTALTAENNLQVNSNFQSQTINRLTSGFRINSSGDDAAGLAVANGLRSTVNELTQGVRNANDGTSILQTIDGGLNNISNILDQLKSLATQSASGTFSGNRSTLNQEFTTLLGEIDRQAANIGLGTGTGTSAAYNASIWSISAAAARRRTPRSRSI